MEPFKLNFRKVKWGIKPNYPSIHCLKHWMMLQHLNTSCLLTSRENCKTIINLTNGYGSASVILQFYDRSSREYFAWMACNSVLLMGLRQRESEWRLPRLEVFVSLVRLNLLRLTVSDSPLPFPSSAREDSVNSKRSGASFAAN